MTTPTINLNGTSVNMLSDQYGLAVHYLRRAITSLGDTAPHGRDYSHSLSEAQREHRSRDARLRAVLVELETLQWHVVNQEVGA